MGGPPGGKTYIGWWGHLGSLPQKGIVTYSLSPYAVRPMAGTITKQIFNGARRAGRASIFLIPPVIIYYSVTTWAKERNEYYNSKEGRYAAMQEQ